MTYCLVVELKIYYYSTSSANDHLLSLRTNIRIVHRDFKIDDLAIYVLLDKISDFGLTELNEDIYIYSNTHINTWILLELCKFIYN